MGEMTLGQKVKEARIAKQLTQKELAGDFITRNMLSQIENDSATPSIKTIEYIASVLNKPVSYFIDDRYTSQLSIIQELLTHYANADYLNCMNLIERYLKISSDNSNNEWVDDFYIKCCRKTGVTYKHNGDFHQAKEILNKGLRFIENKPTDQETYLLLYSFYSLLAEIHGYENEMILCRDSYQKSTEILDQLTHSRLIQNIYITLLEENYDEVLNKADAIDISKLFDEDKCRYYTLKGLANYYKEAFKAAISDLETALNCYQDIPDHNIPLSIYETLSKCYYNLEDYKKAYQLLEISKNKNKNIKENHMPQPN